MLMRSVLSKIRRERGWDILCVFIQTRTLGKYTHERGIDYITFSDKPGPTGMLNTYMAYDNYI